MSQEHETDHDMNRACEHVRTKLPEILEEKPERSADPMVLRHIESCEACAAELDAIRVAMSLLEERTLPTPSPATRTRLLAYARQADSVRQRQGTPVPGRRWQLGMGVAIAASIVLGVWVAGRATSTSILPIEDLGLAPVALTVGDPFPDFVALDVASGAPVSISDLEGDVVLVNIWATWCGPCESEMPSMERLYRELSSSGLSVVAVSVDQESTNKVRQWVDERDLTFIVLHDREGRFERSFQTVGVPESFVIDRDGVLVAREIGPRLWDSPVSRGFIRDLVEGEDR